jgi:hypothetical protein
MNGVASRLTAVSFRRQNFHRSGVAESFFLTCNSEATIFPPRPQVSLALTSVVVEHVSRFHAVHTLKCTGWSLRR